MLYSLMVVWCRASVPCSFVSALWRDLCLLYLKHLFWLAPWNSWDAELQWQRWQELSVMLGPSLQLGSVSPKELLLIEASSEMKQGQENLPQNLLVKPSAEEKFKLAEEIPQVCFQKCLGPHFRSEFLLEVGVLIVCNSKTKLLCMIMAPNFLVLCN